MFDIATAQSLTEREINGLVAEAASLDARQLGRPTRCTGWAVRDVLSHAGLAALRQAEAFRRAAAGQMEMPEYPGAPDLEDAAVLEQLQRGAADLIDALHALSPSVMEGLVPLPFGVVPAPVAIQIAVYEYAFHRNDVSWALDVRAPLPADVAAEFIGFIPGLAPMLAAGTWSVAAEPPILTYCLVAPSGMVVLTNTGKGFELAEPSPGHSVCEIAGDDSSIGLFVMGRLPAASPELTLGGDAPGAAHDFKRWFPGP